MAFLVASQHSHRTAGLIQVMDAPLNWLWHYSVRWLLRPIQGYPWAFLVRAGGQGRDGRSVQVGTLVVPWLEVGLELGEARLLQC